MKNRWAWLAGACCTWTFAAEGVARAEEPKPAPATTGAPAAPAAHAEDDDGPFAPRGRTGKLRETAPEAKKEEAPEIEHEAPPARIGLDMVIAFGKRIDALGKTDDTTPISFVVGGGYRLTESFGLGLRVPLSTASVILGDGQSAQSGTAFGNVELESAYYLKLAPHLEMPIELGLALPTAGGDEFSEDQSKKRAALVNEAAAQSRAFEDDALFSPHRFGIVPKVALEHERGGYAANAYTKLEILAKVGGTAPGEAEGLKQNGVALVWVTGGDAMWDVLRDRLSVGTRLWLAVLAKDAVEAPSLPNVSGPSPVQLALEPTVRGKLGPFFATAGWVEPIGGRLGGNMTGVRLGVGATF